jgi:hypothetical protein
MNTPTTTDNLIVIHTPETNEWGVSFTSHNPEPEHYVACKSEADAFRLQKLFKERVQ